MALTFRTAMLVRGRRGRARHARGLHALCPRPGARASCRGSAGSRSAAALCGGAGSAATSMSLLTASRSSASSGPKRQDERALHRPDRRRSVPTGHRRRQLAAGADRGGRADRAALSGLSLETAEMAEANMRLYRRHGFEIVGPWPARLTASMPTRGSTWRSRSRDERRSQDDRIAIEAAEAARGRRARARRRAPARRSGCTSRPMAIVPSMRASTAPRHMCTPEPKAKCRLGSRPASKRSGSANCAGSRLAAPMPIWM